MTRGRKRKPTVLLKATGGYRPDRHDRKDEPQVKSEAPQCPGHLSDEAKKEWRRLCKLLTAACIITKLDRSTLAVYCEAWSAWVEAKADILEKGRILTGETGGLYTNPSVGIYNKAIEHMAKYGAALGLDPSSRTKIKVDKPKEKDKKLLKYFKTETA